MHNRETILKVKGDLLEFIGFVMWWSCVVYRFLFFLFLFLSLPVKKEVFDINGAQMLTLYVFILFLLLDWHDKPPSEYMNWCKHQTNNLLNKYVKVSIYITISKMRLKIEFSFHIIAKFINCWNNCVLYLFFFLVFYLFIYIHFIINLKFLHKFHWF